MIREGRLIYDPHEGNVYTSKGGEVTTQNSFSPLDDTPNNGRKEDSHHREKPPDLTASQEVQDNNSVYFNEFSNFISDCIYNFDSNTYNIDDHKIFMYNNKYNFCSGYFPDFIFIPHVFDKSFIDTINPRYYPHICNGKYTKQISNANSRYNIKYFSKM